MKFPFVRHIAALLSATLTLTAVAPVFALTAPAACFADSATLKGLTPKCAAVQRAGQSLAYPKLDWQPVGSYNVAASPTSDALRLAGSQSERLNTKSADFLLNVEAADVAEALHLFPTNAPMVFGRYDIANAELVVDILKLVKTKGVATMYRATFAPEHGNYWRAAGAYPTLSAYSSGGLGRNPFEAWVGGGDGSFKSISLEAAQVAIGHAMRLTQAPVSTLAVVSTDMHTTTNRFRCGLKKCVRVRYYSDHATTWYVGAPRTVTPGGAALIPSSFCITNPATSVASCPLSDMVSAGVAFQQQEGGSFENEEISTYLGVHKSSSWSLLGVILVGFALGIPPSVVAPIAVASGITAANRYTAASIPSAAGGSAGTTLTSNGTVASMTSLDAATVAATPVGGLSMLGGADRSASPSALSRTAATTTAKTSGFDKSNDWVEKAANAARPYVSGNLTALHVDAPARKSILGECGLTARASACAGKSQGMVQRADNIVTTDGWKLYRDTGSAIARGLDTTYAAD